MSVRLDAHANHEVVSDTASHLVDDFEREAQPILEGATVIVCALVVEGREKLVEKVAVRDVYLDTVETTLARVFG